MIPLRTIFGGTLLSLSPSSFFLYFPLWGSKIPHVEHVKSQADQSITNHFFSILSSLITFTFFFFEKFSSSPCYFYVIPYVANQLGLSRSRSSSTLYLVRYYPCSTYYAVARQQHAAEYVGLSPSCGILSSLRPSLSFSLFVICLKPFQISWIELSLFSRLLLAVY